MARRLSKDKKIKILEKAKLSKSSISKICRQNKISRITFYKWKKELEHLLLSKPIRVRTYRGTASDRRLLIEAVSSHGFRVTEVCRRFNVSRATYYKWKKRTDSGLVVENYNQLKRKSAKSCTEGQIKAVLSIAYCYPKYSIRRISNLLKEAGSEWQLSSHGVYNVLKRYSLTTYQARLQWPKTLN